MKIREVPFEFAPDTVQAKRSVGLHLSQIIREIERDMYGAEKRPEITPDQERRLQAQWEAGLVWEKAIGLAYAMHYGESRKGLVYQKEFQVDGVYLTPDCLDHKNKVVEEYKWTKVSLNRFDREGLEKVWPGYLMQMKAYCKAAGYSKALLVVLFVNGDYRWGTPGADPTPKRFEIEFTRQEVEENWLLILGKKREMERRARRKGAGDDADADAGGDAHGRVRRPLAAGLHRNRVVPGVGRALGEEARRGAGEGEVERAGLAGRAGQVERVPWAGRSLDFSGLDDD